MPNNKRNIGAVMRESYVQGRIHDRAIFLLNSKFHRIVYLLPGGLPPDSFSKKLFTIINEKLTGTDSKQFLSSVSGYSTHRIIHVEKTLFSIVYLVNGGWCIFDQVIRFFLARFQGILHLLAFSDVPVYPEPSISIFSQPYRY